MNHFMFYAPFMFSSGLVVEFVTAPMDEAVKRQRKKEENVADVDCGVCFLFFVLTEHIRKVRR